MQHILGVSMPRSGHHYLARLLRSYFGSKMGYCEFYKPKDCCHQIPCTKVGPKKEVFYQKNHDHQLALTVSPDAPYVLLIQFRHPVFRTSSNFELEIRNREFLNNLTHMQYYLALQARYYVGFWRKWIDAELPRPSFLLEYSELLAQPQSEMERLVAFLQQPVDADRVKDAIEENQKTDNEGRPFRERTIDRIPPAHIPYLAVMEDIIFRSGIQMPMYQQLLKEHVDPDSPIYDVYESFERDDAGDVEGAAALLERALEKGVDAPRMLVRLAALHRRLKNKARSSDLIRLAHAKTPDDPLVKNSLKHVA